MKRIFLLLLLPVGFAHGQMSPMIPGYQPPKLQLLGTDIQGNSLFQPPVIKGQTNLDDFKKNLGKEGFELYSRSISGAIELEGRFSHRTVDGSSVYSVQPDNMPCLVPNMANIERMPANRIRNAQSMEAMPNAGPRIKLLPETRTK